MFIIKKGLIRFRISPFHLLVFIKLFDDDLFDMDGIFVLRL